MDAVYYGCDQLLLNGDDSELKEWTLLVRRGQCRSLARGLRPVDAGARGWRERGVAPGSGGGLAHRVDQARRDAAAAQMVERGGNLRLARIAVLSQQGDGRHDEAGNAEAALHDLCRQERGLHRMAAVACQPFDGGDEGPFEAADRDLARLYRASVDIDGTCPAMAGAALKRRVVLYDSY